MSIHMSLRLAWHNDGWNGHVCKFPCENTYCNGQHSYPGTLIKENQDIEFESEHAGESMSKLPCPIACALSANAFGKDTIKAISNPPVWWNGGASPAEIIIPPYTACTWCYEAMYNDSVLAKPSSGRTYDYDERRRQAETYFAQFEEGKSLVFYCSGLSNPFSENEESNYVLIGLSRLKEIGDFLFYPNASEEIRKDYAGAIVWQKPITSNYPDEGFQLPYWKYKNDEDILNRIVVKPQNRAPFKYGSREVSNDDAIEVVNQFINSVDVLIEIGDTTENWNVRREWLCNLLNELWRARGPYPGFAACLSVLKLTELIQPYINLTQDADMSSFRDDVASFLSSSSDSVAGVRVSNARDVRREFFLLEESAKELLLNILPRFDLATYQIERIISENRGDYSITASLDEILENPYVIFEQYIGIDSDDSIPFYKIDNGIIPSPEYGLENIFSVGSTERLRALCVDELNRIAAHSFGNADTILSSINHRIDNWPEWKRYNFKSKNLSFEADILEKALFIRKDGDKIYLYLKSVYEDERIVEESIKKLANRPDIPLRRAIKKERFIDFLRKENSEVNKKAHEEYDSIIDAQADICMQIFTKPICVLSGAAGTGKTTVIDAIVENINRVHGEAAGFLLMAPTGKATERIKVQTGKNSMTIHSFLASNGWINANFTLKRIGGKQASDLNTIIIDECSMIDLSLFSALLKAININSIQRLILIGDPNQLPPIGRGRVFADIIDWLLQEYPENVGILTENIRQLVNRVEGNGNGILDLASLYIQENQRAPEEGTTENIELLKSKKEEMFEKILEYGNGNIDKDLSVYFWKDQTELQHILGTRMEKDMETLSGLKADDDNVSKNDLWTKSIKNEDGSANPERIQVISPYKGEYYGTDAINKLLQAEINGFWSKRFNLEGVSYFDKVIQFRNRPKSDLAYAYNFETKSMQRSEVYNGEIGTVLVHGLDTKNKHYYYQNQLKRIWVSFSNKSRKNLRYCFGKELWKDEKGKFIPQQNVSENLELAYAISIHKSQGSEFDYLYIILPKRDSHLLSMELLYTAITRAQKHVTLLLQDDISSLSGLCHIEKSAVNRINSSIFDFNPLPDEVLYIQNWYSDKKVLSTLSKYFVRSKSEVIITNLLAEENIPFTYEEPLYAPDGTMYLPDFTVTFQGEQYYWEHVGMLNRPDYKAHWDKKEEWYNKNFPGKLIVTYENNDLSKEAMKIINEYR